MTPADFAAWVEMMRSTRRWSDAECARQLGCGPNQITRWRKTGAPAYIALACAALAYGLPPWRTIKMIRYTVAANSLVNEVEAPNPEAAILAHVRDAGYSSVKEAAEVCGQTEDEFLADITVLEAE